MTVTQSAFTENPPIGYPGMEADGELSNIITAYLEGATACEFGRPVFKGAADDGATLVVSAALRGFARANKGLPVTSTRAADTYAPGDVMEIKERGKIFVNCATAANKDAQVYITAAGLVTATVGANQIATGWVFDTTIAAAGITRIVRR